MTTQPMDADWLAFHPNLKIFDFVLPEGAVDAQSRTVLCEVNLRFA